MNVNRMLVHPTDNHITEERLIEEKMAEGVRHLKSLTCLLDERLYDCNWFEAGKVANEIETAAEYMQKLAYRLHDVRGINEQFAKIQAHIDRIEAQLTTQGDSQC